VHQPHHVAESVFEAVPQAAQGADHFRGGDGAEFAKAVQHPHYPDPSRLEQGQQVEQGALRGKGILHRLILLVMAGDGLLQ
jgi:hypothetical protein